MAALVAVLVAALAGTLLAGCTGPGSGDGDQAPSAGQVRTFLTRYSAAMTGRDQNAVSSLLDDSDAAQDFRSAQLTQFANLAQLPVQSWRVSELGPVNGLDRSALAKRYGAPVTVMHLQLSYQLRGVDPGPTTRDLWWTFVRRHGAVQAASSTDVADQGGTSWRGPWEFGPVVADTGPGAVVIGPPADLTRVRAVRAMLSRAISAVSAVWGENWARGATVVIPGNTAELQALTSGGSETAVSDTAAQTLVSTPDPATGLSPGALVVLVPATFFALGPADQARIVTHELTHVASAADADTLPRWLVEGLAEYVSRRGSSQSPRQAAPELAGQVRAGRLPTALPTDADFSTAPALSYEQAWLACAYLAARIGPAGLVRLYRQVSELGQTDADPQTTVATALRSVARVSLPVFVAGWQAYLREQLR